MKCQFCNKKAGLMTFNCKCDFTDLCIKCRYADMHNCDYDPKPDHKQKIKKENPVLVPEKIIKL